MSFQDTLPYVLTGVDQPVPWFDDLVNTTLKPFMYTAYTAPVFRTTSMIGSNWPEPLQAQSGLPASNVRPPSLLTWSAIQGDGQFPEQGLAA